MVQQCIDQGATIAIVIGGAGASVHHHAGGLVDDGNIVVLVHDLKRNIFGDSAYWLALGGAKNLHSFVAAQAERCFRTAVIDDDELLLNQLLHARARDVGQVGDKELVQAFSGVVFGRLKRGRSVIGHEGRVYESGRSDWAEALTAHLSGCRGESVTAMRAL